MLERIGKGILVILLVLALFSVWVSQSNAEPPALSRLSGAEKERVAKLIEGAKKEGELVGYSGVLRPDVQADLFPKFREVYGLSEADFKLKIVDMRTDAVITKVTEELRAKVYKTDIASNTAFPWFIDLVARGELMAYDSPEYKYFSPLAVSPEIGQGNLPYFISGCFTPYTIIYNPKYVKGKIEHWKDVLRPQYKGKIIIGDVSRSASYTEVYLATRRVLNEGFFRELGKQEPFVIVAASDLVNKAITGEFPIALFVSTGPAFRANLQGGGLKILFPPEGYAAIGRQIAILARAPHPNAAKLFIDFFHSALVQKMLMEKEGYPTGRVGVKSKYPDFPVPISDLKGAIQMDWRKLNIKDRDHAREEFRRLVIEKK